MNHVVGRHSKQPTEDWRKKHKLKQYKHILFPFHILYITYQQQSRADRQCILYTVASSIKNHQVTTKVHQNHGTLMLSGGDEAAVETTVTLPNYKVSSSDTVSVLVLTRGSSSSPSYRKNKAEGGRRKLASDYSVRLAITHLLHLYYTVTTHLLHTMHTVSHT